MSRADSNELQIAGEPRVDLLPPAVKARRKAKAVRRVFLLAFAGIVLIVVAGIGAATFSASQSRAELAAAQARTDDVLAQQTQFVTVRQTQNEFRAVKAAQQAGASIEVNWRSYLTQVREALPADVTIDSINVESSTPVNLFEQPDAPLEAERVATVSLAVSSPALPTVPAWLEALQSLPGYADGKPTAITRTDTGVYIVNLTLHLNREAYSHRFADEAETRAVPDKGTGAKMANAAAGKGE